MVFDYRSNFPILQREEIHYLDNASMTQSPQCVIDASVQFDLGFRANVNRGIYKLADMATCAYEESRDRVAKFLNAKNKNEIIFTSGTTAAINIIAQSICKDLSPGDEIVLSQLEHHSNLVPWQLASEGRGIKIKFIPVTEDGRLDLSVLEQLITDRCRIIALTHGSNVTGAITDVETVVTAARSVGAYILLDGAQVAPHQKIDVQNLNVDFYTFSGHKLYGPTGIGVLWGNFEVLEKLKPATGGGGMIQEITEFKTTFSPTPYKFEAGTPPIAQAVSLAAAIEWVNCLDRVQIEYQLRNLTQKLFLEINSLPGVAVLGPNPLQHNTLPIVSFYMEDIHPHDICQILSMKNVAVRGGHHCAQPLMNIYQITGTTRASLAPYNDEKDIDALIMGLEETLSLLK